MQFVRNSIEGIGKARRVERGLRGREKSGWMKKYLQITQPCAETNF